jgi:VanZ family protein
MAAVVWGLFLLALTSWPSPPEVPVISQIPDFDKVVHSLLYGVEGFLLYFAVAWPGVPRFSWMRAATVAAAIAFWGTLDEVHQAWIPGRSMEGADALADTVAGFLGAVVASTASRTSRSRRSASAGD